MIANRLAQRERAQEWMTHFLDPSPPTHEEIDRNLLDFGFYHAFEQVARMYAEYTNHGNYGYGNGRAVLEQPDEYWHDMATMYWLKMWNEHIKPLPRMKPISWINKETGTANLMGKLDNGDD